MTEQPLKCVEPAGKPPVGDVAQLEAAPSQPTKEVPMEVARVGKKAPDFAANAYFAGGFKKVSLSDYAGKWTVICFYPGDFTFV